MNRKRKHAPSQNPDSYHAGNSSSSKIQFLEHHESFDNPWASASKPPDPLLALHMQAHEADLVHGSHTKAAAQSLEVVEYRQIESSDGSTWVQLPRIGSALIKLGGEATFGPEGFEDEEMPTSRPESHTEAAWVDRYV